MAEHRSQSSQASTIPVCGIGASAGGLEALQKFFSALPDDLGLAYVVILHLAPDRKSDLPAIISRWTKMPVAQVGDHDSVKLDPNQVYVIAPNRKLEITDNSVGASKFEQARGQRAAVDLFFRSLAASHGDAFAVVLSGSGSDGALGARAVKEAGGLVFVQDPNEASHADMPKAVIATGVADVILPVSELVARLAELVRGKESIVSVVRAAEQGVRVDRDQEKALRGIFDLLRKRTKHDFSKYKRNTVLRRLARRMQLCHQATISDYLQYIRAHLTESQQLFDDLLISVTTFFRDPQSWTALQSLVIGPLIEHTDADDQIRAWVSGCSTGEEAYSLAILFHEEFERRSIERDLVIFASDVDEGALVVAREGRYPNAISADVSDARLERYFRPESDHYRVVSAIRDRVVFASHSLLKDPPFSRQHLISCRNLLIYLDRELQEQAMTIFRYACQDHAYLFLGASEVADEALFQPLNKNHRIFVTRELPEGGRLPLPPVLETPLDSLVVRQGREARTAPRSSVAELHNAALEEVGPPSLLIDEQWNVLHLSSSASRFLQQIGGPLAHRIIDLVRSELRDELHALLHRAFEGLEPQLSPFISVAFNGAARRVALLAQQRPERKGVGRQVLITFLDAGEATSTSQHTENEPASELVRSLREKLREAERHIERIHEDHYLTNEELRSANEELQSLNEEYRSTTEELETSKEELQSINEELQTINHQLKQKLEEVSHANSDLENLMAATDVATLFLDSDCRISRFTPRLSEIFRVQASDRERPISDFSHNLDYDTLQKDVRDVLASSAPLEREVRSHEGRVFVVRLRPYQKAGGGLDGVVVTFIEITAIKQAEAALRESEQKLAVELEVMRVLHRTAMMVIGAPTMQGAVDEILTAAITVTGADFGTVQLFDPDSQRLRIVGQRGFTGPFLEAFASIGSEDPSACGRALRTRETVCIEDVAQDSEYAPFYEAAAKAGYRAVQSEPLVGKGGELVGVLSIHFRQPRAFSDRDRQVGGLVARQVADLIINRSHQENIARLNEALSRRTAELEASQEQLSAQATKLLEQDRNKEAFLASLGHELRAPMAAIQNNLELVTATDESSQSAIAGLKRQSRHLSSLVDDLLDIARINRGRLQIRPEVIELIQCVRESADSVLSRAQAKGLALELDLPESPIKVTADPVRVSQILDNLLSNAVNYTDHGAITIRVRSDARHARITIRDTGVGIDPGELATIFEPFQQTDESRRAGGLGLGLSLVKRLVEMHQGTMEFWSEGRGLGSEVVFTLPLSPLPLSRSAAAATISSSDHVVPPPPRRILIIEYYPDSANAFGRLLERIGQQVRIAYSGEVGLQTAREQRPQVAFVDIGMRGMSGVEVAQHLRQEFPSTELTLVALSGYPEGYAGFQESQFDHYLLKPATMESIVALLNSLPTGRES